MITATLCLALLASCQSAPVDLDKFAATNPQHGLIRGPDGWYLTRQDGPWGTDAKQQIWRLRDGDSSFSQPEWVDVNASESDFYYSSSQRMFCFVSDRPDGVGVRGRDANIWCGGWDEDGWRPPTMLPKPVNSSAAEFSPVIAPTGDLYFASDRPGGAGLGDLYQATRQREAFWNVARLDAAVNSAGGEWNLDLSPDGGMLVFEASHRSTNKSTAGDLYISYLGKTGWKPSTPLVDLNTEGSDLIPRFYSNEAIIFTSVIDGKASFHIAKLPK